MKKVFLFAILLLTINSKAQINIGMSHIRPFGLIDSIPAGNSAVYPVWVKNYSTTTFSDSLTLYTAVEDTNGGIGPINIVSSYNSNGVITIAPNDSVSFSLTSTYTTSGNGYRLGIDVIVVWPVASSANTVDSLSFNLFIQDPNGVNEIDLMKEIKLFPNPTIDYLQLTSDQTVSINSVRMYDSKGSEVGVRLSGNTINVEHLVKGVYSIDIEFNNKKHFKAKFIKQ